MKKTLTIEGMTCKNCVRHVTEALEEVKGVKSVKVDLDTNSAVVVMEKDIDDEVFKDVVYDAGYDVTSIK